MAPPPHWPSAITQPNLLVTEGPDDREFFTTFLEQLGIETLQVIGIGGKYHLRDYLKTLIKTPGFSNVTSLGIIRDADDNPQSTFDSISDALKAVDLPTPNTPYAVLGGQPRIAILILPDASSTGELEDLCLRSIDDDPAMQCVEQFFFCLEEQQLTPPKKTAKAKVQVFLASRHKIDWRLGIAARRGHWPWEHPAFSEIKDCLLELFGQ